MYSLPFICSYKFKRHPFNLFNLFFFKKYYYCYHCYDGMCVVGCMWYGTQVGARGQLCVVVCLLPHLHQVWDLGIKLRSPGLCSKHFILLIHQSTHQPFQFNFFLCFVFNSLYGGKCEILVFVSVFAFSGCNVLQFHLFSRKWNS